MPLSAMRTSNPSGWKKTSLVLPEDERIARAWDLFSRLRERRDNSGAQLSGGEQQMLAVARAMVPGPKSSVALTRCAGEKHR